LRSWPVRLCRQVAETYSRCSVSQGAGALAYCLVLSVFPLMMCITYLVGLAGPSLEQLLRPWRGVLPEQVMVLVQAYLREVGRGPSLAAFLAGLGSLLVSASAGLRGVMHTMDRLYGRRPGRGVGRVAVSVVLAALSLLAVYASAAVVLTGGWVAQLLEGLLPQWVWTGLGYVLPLCFMLLPVLAVYWAGSPRRLRDGRLVLNAGASALAIAVCSGVFSRFVGISARYPVVYGSLASIIVLLVWLYLCGNILLTGAVVGWVLRNHD